MTDDLDVSEEVHRQEQRDREAAYRAQERPKRPDEPAARRTPNMQEVLHAAEDLAAVDMPARTPPTPINDTGKLAAMARMGGKVDPGLGAAGPTLVGEDIGRQVDAVLEDIGVEILDRERRR